MTPGQAVFIKWAELVIPPIDYITWEDLSIEAKENWEQVAKAAIEASS